MTPQIGNEHILYEHKDFLVVAKPAGIPVHHDGFFCTSPPLLQQVRDLIGKRVWPVHRIDRQCSGCVLFAKHSDYVSELQLALQNGKKKYIALVRGIIKNTEPIVISTPIKVDKIQNNYKEAKTLVRCLNIHQDPPCSIVLAEPQTGRKHQVRRHLRDISHPIIHDGDHGDSRVNRYWRENRGMKRLGLHALSLEIQYQNTTYDIKCPLFQDHYLVYKELDFWSQLQHQFPIFTESK